MKIVRNTHQYFILNWWMNILPMLLNKIFSRLIFRYITLQYFRKYDGVSISWKSMNSLILLTFLFWVCYPPQNVHQESTHLVPPFPLLVFVFLEFPRKIRTEICFSLYNIQFGESSRLYWYPNIISAQENIVIVKKILWILMKHYTEGS